MLGRTSTVMEHFGQPRNQGGLEDYDCEGLASVRSHGPFMRIYLRLDGEVITVARFQTFGCGIAIACGSFLTETITGRTIAECRAISASELEAALGGLPAARRFCAQFEGYSRWTILRLFMLASDM